MQQIRAKKVEVSRPGIFAGSGDRAIMTIVPDEGETFQILVTRTQAEHAAMQLEGIAKELPKS